jgi:Gamma-glutamyl cyclotransferase, AIG2-like
MSFVFQYGSNMSVARLNHVDRLAGDAKVVAVAKTVELFELGFTVWSKSNACAAADIAPSATGTQVYGVVYEISDFLISRDTAKVHGRKSMDAIEGEGTNYVRQTLELERLDGSTFSAVTYVVKDRSAGHKTSLPYVQHILDGLKEHRIPTEYQRYVASRIIQNNPTLQEELSCLQRDA